MIRACRPEDLPALHAINAASTPGVSEESLDSLAACFTAGACHVAVDEAGAPLGFINLLAPGVTGYPSPNYAWFEARGGEYVYVDRIALAPAARGRGLGRRLYAHAFQLYAGRRKEIVCEVNTTPPNPGSLRFHASLGFEEVGRAAHRPGVYEVAFLARPL